MNFYDKDYSFALKTYHSNDKYGLGLNAIENSRKVHGANTLTGGKEKGIIYSVLSALKEPMLVILIISFVISLGTDIGRSFKTHNADFTECIGILLAIVLSVSITLIMEGSSKKAFRALNAVYDNLTVKVIREGQTVVLNQKQVVCGDILLLNSGEKIVADARLIESTALEIDESALTGESLSVYKNADISLTSNTPLAERANMVYSGTFVKNGNGKAVVTAVGNQTEMGLIAKEISVNAEESPLNQKLSKLGKTITIIGVSVSILVFILSIAKLAITKSLTFGAFQELFIASVVLIVAAVPEGLPTIVAVSLALNMIKLARENALIKKMVATETAGAVSVICTDKTGTLTKNDMQVIRVCLQNKCYTEFNKLKDEIKQNFICNNQTEIAYQNGVKTLLGSATEKALINSILKADKKFNVNEYRSNLSAKIILPFNSKEKYMLSRINIGDEFRYLIKGAPEKVLEFCNVSKERKEKILSDISLAQKRAERVLCFAHLDSKEEYIPKSEYLFDGYTTIADPVREEVKSAIKDCKTAGIKVKILTGDNKHTALAVALESGVSVSGEGVIDASELDKLDDTAFIKALDRITVIARSTPLMKLRVVKALKQKGEVVAVTGDGINDAPAIKRADVGIAMGSGSEISKESADVILLDDSFLTVVKAISFGRNVYKNLQRFIIFQLSVNLSALLFIATCAVLGLKSPFNTLQLLWINVIMDGPPALTLGLEKCGKSLMQSPPVNRKDGLISKKMFMKIIFSGLFISTFMIMEYLFDFLRAGEKQSSVVFTLFILFQLFNAFNCRELGIESILAGIKKNKIMAITFSVVFVVHFIIVELLGELFSVSSMSGVLWLKCILVSSSIIIVSEVFKLILRLFRKTRINRVILQKKNQSVNNLISGA